jgi:Fur family transcriptional regulator, ferric uptake regulator
MSDDVHSIVSEQLRRTRQRYTLGRRQLVDMLVGSERPMTIPELIGAGATQSQSSLYRNLAILEQCGAVHRIASTDDVARYELTEELSEHHHHLVCTVCGRLDDVVLPPRIERALDEADAQAEREHGFQVSAHRVDFVGVCADCA